MSITRGYCTLVEFKEYAKIENAEFIDDSVIENLIEGASRWIDNETRRTFYARLLETRYFDCPHGTNDNRMLWLDDDLVSIDAGGLINGDTTVITSADYNLVPKNHTPKWGIHLKRTSNYHWEPDADGEYESVISVKGTWGYSATAPDEVKAACMMITKSMYARRTGENVSSTSIATAAGVVITPEGIPAEARQLIAAYKRVVWV